jgi:hypothetical protein
VTTGQQLAREIREAAEAADMSLYRFLQPICRNPSSFMNQLQRAAEPRPFTLARVRALINGTPMPQLTRKIVVTISHDAWRRLDATARQTRRKVADVAADYVARQAGDA